MKVGGINKKGVEKIQLQKCDWDEKHARDFQECRDALENKMIIDQRDAYKILCIYTDACDDIWYGIATN